MINLQSSLKFKMSTCALYCQDIFLYIFLYSRNQCPFFVHVVVSITCFCPTPCYSVLLVFYVMSLNWPLRFNDARNFGSFSFLVCVIEQCCNFFTDTSYHYSSCPVPLLYYYYLNEPYHRHYTHTRAVFMSIDHILRVTDWLKT